jgi:hypothetical protein
VIFGQVVEAAEEVMDRKSLLFFNYNPNSTPVGERNNTSRPDGQMELIERKSLGTAAPDEGILGSAGLGKKVLGVAETIGRSFRQSTKAAFQDTSDNSHWEDIVLSCEFKLEADGQKDVRSSARLSSAIYYMNSHRTSTNSFGVPTIFCVQTHVVVSLLVSPQKMIRCGSGTSRGPT